MQKYSGQQWCRDISESGPTVARQWPDSARQGPTPRQSGLKDTGPAVRHVRHPRHLRHARHSDTRHSDTLRHDARASPVQPPSDTGQTQARHLRHRRHQCQSTPLRHCSDTTPTPPTPPTLRHIRAQLPVRSERLTTSTPRPLPLLWSPMSLPQPWADPMGRPDRLRATRGMRRRPVTAGCRARCGGTEIGR